MSEEREPMRLRDDPAEDPQLRAALDAARGEIAPDAMLERVLGNITGGGGGGGGGAGGAAASTKLAVAIAAAAIAAVALLGTQLAGTTEPSPRVVFAVDASIAPDAGTDAGRDAGPDASGVDAATTLARHVHTPREPTPPDPGPDDATLLFAATRARSTDPARSLALALDHRARFPESASAEDREALVVLDLAALGRASDARSAATTFYARWPSSAYRPRIDPVLARLPP